MPKLLMPKLSFAFKSSILIIAILTAGAFGQKSPDSKSSGLAREIETPAPDASGEPNLFVAGDGRIFLNWIEPAGENLNRLRFATRSNGQWSEPRTIAEGKDWLVNWADFPSLIALPNGTLLTQWRVKSGAGHASDIYVARSTDGGKSWSKPMLLHSDGTKTEHGFVSMLGLTAGRAAAVWLDGRNFKQNSDGEHDLTNEMTLRHAMIEAGGKLSEESMIDSRVCDCCQTSAAMTSQGAVVVYRDRSEKEVRDISIIRYEKGRWTAPRTVHADGWEINGCPVNGPSVDARRRNLAVAWFTAAKNTPRVNVIFSSDAGASFGQPVQVDEGNPVGRVQVAMLADGAALVLWLERTAKGAEIKARRVRPDGSRDRAITIAESSDARASGLPRMAVAGEEVVFAWMRPGKPSRVRAAVLNLSDYR